MYKTSIKLNTLKACIEGEDKEWVEKVFLQFLKTIPMDLKTSSIALDRITDETGLSVDNSDELILKDDFCHKDIIVNNNQQVDIKKDICLSKEKFDKESERVLVALNILTDSREKKWFSIKDIKEKFADSDSEVPSNIYKFMYGNIRNEFVETIKDEASNKVLYKISEKGKKKCLDILNEHINDDVVTIPPREIPDQKNVYLWEKIQDKGDLVILIMATYFAGNEYATREELEEIVFDKLRLGVTKRQIGYGIEKVYDCLEKKKNGKHRFYKLTSEGIEKANKIMDKYRTL